MKKLLIVLLTSLATLPVFSRDGEVTVTANDYFPAGEAIVAQGDYVPLDPSWNADHYTWELMACDPDGNPIGGPLFSETFQGTPSEYTFIESASLPVDQNYQIILSVTDISGRGIIPGIKNVVIGSGLFIKVNTACQNPNGTVSISVDGISTLNVSYANMTAVWTVTKCDAAGVINGPVLATSSPQLFPGPYTFPTLTTLSNTYIKIKAVISIPSSPAFAVLYAQKYIGYPFITFAGYPTNNGYSPVNICSTSGASLCIAGMHPGETVGNWLNNNNQVVQTGGTCYTVPYGSSGWYYVNVYNECGQGASWGALVTSYDTDPYFSLTTTPNTGYFMLGCTPAVTTPAAYTSWVIQPVFSTSPFASNGLPTYYNNQSTVYAALNNGWYRITRTVSIPGCAVTTMSKVFNAGGTWCTNCRTGQEGEIETDAVTAASFSVMPNPSNGTFSVQLSATTDNASAELFNLLGERVDAFTFSGNSYSYVPAQILAPGVYLLRISNNGEQVSKRIVIQ